MHRPTHPLVVLVSIGILSAAAPPLRAAMHDEPMPAQSATGIALGGYLSGNWYNPAQGGHGFQLELTTTGEMIAIWFVYTPNGDGQSWIYAEGFWNASSNSVTLPAIILTGARFPPHYNSADVHRQQPQGWGTITFTFSDCYHGTASWHSDAPGYDEANDTPLPINRLTQIDGTTCPTM